MFASVLWSISYEQPQNECRVLEGCSKFIARAGFSNVDSHDMTFVTWNVDYNKALKYVEMLT